VWTAANIWMKAARVLSEKGRHIVGAIMSGKSTKNIYSATRKINWSWICEPHPTHIDIRRFSENKIFGIITSQFQ
jgi:hypothetical protein